MELNDQPEPDYAEPQRQVQRWLGRCMLSLQQSERLLKALLHDANVTVIHSGQEAEGLTPFVVNRAFEEKQLACMTLGGLVTAFFNEIAIADATTADKREEQDLPSDRLSFRANFQLPMSTERLQSLQSSMREMVLLRNEWVHHLVERFNLTSPEGCAHALANLQAGYERAERFRLELRGLAKVRVEASELMASFFSSPHGRALLFDGKVPLDATPLLNALRDAVRGSAPVGELAGAVLFSEVLEKLRSLHPDEHPQNYGYVSWQQVVHESGEFGMVRCDSEGRRIPRLVCLKSTPSRG